MRSDPVDLLVAFALGAFFATALIVAWAYNSAARKGKLDHLKDEDDAG